MRVWCLQRGSSGSGAWHGRRLTEVRGKDAGGETEREETARAEEDEGSKLMAVEREETVLDIRLTNALRGAEEAYSCLASAIKEAVTEGPSNGRLIARLTNREHDALLLVTDLVNIVAERGKPVEAE